MAFALAGAEVGENLHQRFLLHSCDGPRSQPQFALAILVQQSVLDHLLQQFRLLGILAIAHHLLDRLQGLLAVLKDQLHELIDVKELIGSGKFLAVVFAVEVLHRAAILASAEE